MAKTLTIQIKSVDEALKGFRRTFNDVAAGRRLKRREGVYLTTLLPLARRNRARKSWRLTEQMELPWNAEGGEVPRASQ